MSNSALDIENWMKVNINGKIDLRYNHRVQFVGLEIDAIKFYFFLKEKHGLADVAYSSVSQFFPDRMISAGNEWCFLFQESSNFILVCGDDKINITILSLEEPPSKLDFDLFCSKAQTLLKNFSLEKNNHISYDIFINYSFYLNNLISEFKNIIEKRIPQQPEQLSLPTGDINSIDAEVKYKFIENSNDYNQWLNMVIEKATFALKIQILLPIYFESLIDLAFRIKLKKSLFNNNKIYGDREVKLDVFENFETLPIHKKIKEIKSNCFEVNIQKINKFISEMWEDKESGNSKKKERNKLLHGNALFFRNINLKYYVDESRIIGFPDRARGIRVISESIYSTMQDKELLETIRVYEKRCNDFLNIFDDKGYFKSLASGIAFGHNTSSGGSFSLGLNKLADLYAPTEW